MLCDCPGLVMPSFMFTKAEMVVNGILPIDQMRDHVPSVTLVASLIPRHELEYTYGIMLSPPAEGEDPSRPPTAEELLNAYGCMYISVLYKLLILSVKFLCWFMLAVISAGDKYREVGIAVML
jgi:ribosome biogenesis GTPase A